MIIDIGQISEQDGLAVRFQYPEGQPALDSDDGQIEGRPTVHLDASREGKRIELAGHLAAVVAIECGRCLKAFSIPIEQDFDLLYLPPARPGEAPGENALDEDDLGIAIYQDETIDLDGLVREQIELALPMARLCAETCKGLCPDCGANLNELECNCVPEQLDPRWAGLKELKSNNL